MSLVASVVASLLFGVVGSSVTTSVLLYSDVPLNATVQNSSYSLEANQLLSIPVELRVEQGTRKHTITVTGGTVSYEFPVTVEGTREWSWWWLAPAPLFAASLMWLFRRRRAAGKS